MSNSEDKSAVNGGVDPILRLPSFKPPRDLTLGGPKLNKKLFTPNLNVARKKSKGFPSDNANHQKKDEKKKKDYKNDKNRNNRHGPNIIKSGGVFSEGVGRGERHSSRQSYRRDVESTQPVQKPTLRIKDFVKVDSKEEGRAGLPSDPDDEIEDMKRARDVDAPVALSHRHRGCPSRLLRQKMSAVNLKQEPLVKEEPYDDHGMMSECKPEPMLPPCEDQLDVVNLLNSTEPTLILMQLPDALPGLPGRDDTDDDAEDSEAGAGAGAADTQQQENKIPRCQLAHLEEGRVGKLLVYRSGRVALKLGETVFHVSYGTKPSFHEEVVSAATDDASRSASLVSLGALRHHLTLAPDWEDMFRRVSNQHTT